MNKTAFLIGNNGYTIWQRSQGESSLFWLTSQVLKVMALILLLTACQPPTAANTSKSLPPVVISDDSVTMAPDYILTVKPTRYQPSLGLQGRLKPVTSAQLTAKQTLYVQKVFVSQGQWVEKGQALFIVHRQADNTTDNTPLNINTLPVRDDADEWEHEPEVGLTPNTTKNPTNPAMSRMTTQDINSEGRRDNSADNKANATSDNHPDATPIVINAHISGRVGKVSIKNGQDITTGAPLLYIGDDTDLHFIATLGVQAESQLSVGQNVTFNTENTIDTFVGQVSKLSIVNISNNRTNSQTDIQSTKQSNPSQRPQDNKLLVSVHVVKNDASRGKLRPNMMVTGRVDYGQIEVGTIIPERGLHDADLTELQKPPYQPLSTLSANVWIIKQDQRLTRQSVEVINYDPSTGQYLIAGLNNDSLICLADLALESAGKKVVVS